MLTKSSWYILAFHSLLFVTIFSASFTFHARHPDLKYLKIGARDVR